MNTVYFPSYNRSDLVRGFEYLGEGRIVVPESQEKAYRKRYGRHVISIPDSLDGHIARKRNAVLDLIEEREADGMAWIVDDDFINLKRKKENRDMSGDECMEHFERIYIMAKDMKANYGGFDYSGDNMKLKDYQPFSFTKPMFGALLINAMDGVRYDERFRLNEDVDFWIHKLNTGRKLLKDNQYFAIFHGKDGGKDSVINYDRMDQRHLAIMINEKWGYPAMVWNKTRFEFKTKIKGA